MPDQIHPSCNLRLDNFAEADVNYVENPAYVVKEPKQHGKEEGVGCIVAWNRAFESLTNFVPHDIDNKSCFELMGGVQKLKAKDHKHKDGWIKICCGKCRFRINAPPSELQRTGALRNVWINSKDKNGGKIMRLVDIGIFPFDREGNVFALHILFDKRAQHDTNYFFTNIVKERYEKLEEPMALHI